MSKFKSWADRKGDAPKLVLRAEPKVEAVAPRIVITTPAPRPATVQMSWGTVGGRGPATSCDPIPPSVQLMKVDTGRVDPYEALMANVPDLAKASGVEAPAEDAMKMRGVAPGAVMNHWTPSARYYNGVSDLRAEGDFERHRAQSDARILDEQNRR